MTRRLTLSRSYMGFGAVAEAIVREPTGALYFDHGEPYERQISAAGEPVILENTAAVKAYVEACVSFAGESEPMVILRQLCIADARAVKTAVLDFFMDARGSSASSPSSSGTAGPQTPSND